MKTNGLNMEIGKGELLKMLSTYYNETLGKDSIRVKTNNIFLAGNGRDSDDDIEVEFYYTYEENVGTSKVRISENLSENEVINALNNILDKLGYSVETMEYRKRVKPGDWREYDDISFVGVTLKLREKGFSKTLK